MFSTIQHFFLIPCTTFNIICSVCLSSSVGCILGDFEEPRQSNMELRSLADAQTRFPCLYRTEAEEQVVQVTWYKELPDGTKEQIITAHFQDGHTGTSRIRAPSKTGSSGTKRVERGCAVKWARPAVSILFKYI